MVSFKNFLLVTSLVVGQIAAAPTESGIQQVNAFAKTKDANKIFEDEYADRKQINDNGKKATVVNLTGCTGLFFYEGTTLIRTYHVQCIDMAKNSEVAAKDAGDVDSVTIGAIDDHYYGEAKKGIEAAKIHGLKINPKHKYDKPKDDKKAATLTGKDGSLELVNGIADKVSHQPPKRS